MNKSTVNSDREDKRWPDATACGRADPQARVVPHGDVVEFVQAVTAARRRLDRCASARVHVVGRLKL